MELVSKLRKNYTPEEVQEVLDNADTGSSMPELIRDLIIDIPSGAALGAAGGALGAKIASRKPARAAAREAIEQLKNGVDDALGHQTSLIKKGTSKDQSVRKMMAQNKEAAKSVAEGGNGAKALRTILKNSQREAEIGPRFMDDIANILKKDTGLSEKEVKKAIKEFMKKNADNVELITLLEAKDPIATYGHSLGVQDITYKLAKHVGLDDIKARGIADAALVHDIGKIQVPDSIISTKADFNEYKHLKKWMHDHDVVGGEILSTDPFKAHIASSHHPKDGIIGKSDKVNYVTVADLYEAVTSPKRSYRDPGSPADAFEVISKNVAEGNVPEDFLKFIKALREDKVIPERYEITSLLEIPYRSMKANAIKNQVASDYRGEFFKNAAKKWVPFTAASGAALGGVQPSQLPSVSEILSAFSPRFIHKDEKLDDIKRWYSRGHYSDEINNLIVNTDFNDNKQVTKLWKIMRDQIRD